MARTDTIAEFEAADQTGDDDDVVSYEPDSFESREFAPLIETAVPHIYRNNGFRVTGLPVSVTERQVKDFEKLAKVGRATGLQPGPLPLTPDGEAVQSAIERLKNDDLRFVDEFFWFWPTEWNRPIEDNLLGALSRGDVDGAADILMRQESRDQRQKVATHNLAVLFHAAALDLEFESEARRLSDEELKKLDVHWTQSFKYWGALIKHKGFWKHFSSRIDQLEDPRFSAGQIKGSLPSALTQIVAKLARRAAGKGNFSRVANYILLVSGPCLDQRIISRTMAPFARRLRERIKALCASAEKRANHDHRHAHVAVRDLLTQALPLIEAMKQILNEDTQELSDVCGEVADVFQRMFASFGRQAKGWDVCAQQLEKALLITPNQDLRERIANLLDALRQRIEKERREAEFERRASWMDGLLEEVKVILKSSQAPEAKFVKLREILQPRLAFTKQEWGDTSAIHAGACNVLAGGIRSVAMELRNDAGKYQFALDAITMAWDICRNGTLEKQLRSDHTRLAMEQLRRLEARIKPIKANLGSLKEQIDNHAAILRRYKLDSALGCEVDKNSYYNTCVRHDSLVEEHTRLLAEYRSIAASYDELIRDTNEKVDRRISLIRGRNENSSVIRD